MKKAASVIIIILFFISSCTQSINKETLDAYRNDIETLSSLKNRLNEIKKENQILFVYNYKGNVGTFYFEKVKEDSAEKKDKSSGLEDNNYTCEGAFHFNDSTSISLQINEKGKLKTEILTENEPSPATKKIIENMKCLEDLPGFSELVKTAVPIDEMYSDLETVEFDDYIPICHREEDLNVCRIENERIEFTLDDFLISTEFTDTNKNIRYYFRTIDGTFDKKARKYLLGY